MLSLSMGLLAVAAVGLVLQPAPTAEAQGHGNQVRAGFLSNWVGEVKREVVTSRSIVQEKPEEGWRSGTLASQLSIICKAKLPRFC